MDKKRCKFCQEEFYPHAPAQLYCDAFCYKQNRHRPNLLGKMLRAQRLAIQAKERRQS
jgi:hypothetical protein